MPNHYHLILHVDLELLNRLTDDQIIDRYHQIYRPDELMALYRDGDDLTEDELEHVELTLAQWRENLSSISRLIAYINEQIARAGNKEDGRTGRFWEGRFHSQALLDETALLQCMTYVDLNPIRAGIAPTPETSEHTSIKHRIEKRAKQQPDLLMPFMTSQHDPSPDTDYPETTLPITFSNYLELVEWTGRILRDDKPGAIDSSIPDILVRLGCAYPDWKTTMANATLYKRKALGTESSLADYLESIGQRWFWSWSSPPNG